MKLPKKYKLHKGYVMLEVFEKDTFDEEMGLDMPAYEKDTFSEELRVERVGGGLLWRLWMWHLGVSRGRTAIINRSMDNLLESEGRKFKVVFVEDIKITYE